MATVRVYGETGSLQQTVGAAMQKLNVSTEVKRLETLKTFTTHVMVSVEGAARVRFDGVDPTTSEGMLIEDATPVWSRELALAARFIRNGTTDAVVRAQEMRPMCW